MNRIAVELTGTSPTLHNNCQTRGEDPGWRPKTDYEQAVSRVYAYASGGMYLPWYIPVIAIGRAAWSRLGVCGLRWPKEIIHAERTQSIRSTPVMFFGDWVPQVLLRRDLPPVALPRFDRWSASFRMSYDPDQHDESTLRDLLEHSGRHIGLPQFAPFAGPGPWGRFEVTKWEPVAAVAKGETIEAR